MSETEKTIQDIKALLDMDARGALVPHGVGGLARKLLSKCAELLAQPAEQPQGEPVAFVRFRNGEPDYDGDACMIMNVPGDTLGDGDGWEPVFIHANPAEAERKVVKRYDRDEVSGHNDVEITVPGLLHHDHGPNLAEALARLALRVARFHKLDAPTLADPGEVERLCEHVSAYKASRERLHKWLREEQLKNIALRAQLAEAQEVLRMFAENSDDKDVVELSRHALSASAEPSAPILFQARVQPWLLECFGEMIAGDREERNHRFLEEALELVQALGATAAEAHQLVDYVIGRAVGEPSQEVGGVMVTLAALCLANDLDMHQLAETELARIWTKVDAIRAKQASKPQFGPLPGVYPGRESSAPVEIDERAAYDAWRHSESGYVRPFDRHEWSAWQARAALERKP